MKKLLIILLILLFITSCAGSQMSSSGQYIEYENAIQIGNKIIRINKDFKYAGNLSTSHDLEYLDGPPGTAQMETGEHFFMNVNPNNKIDKTIIVYSYTLEKQGDYWRGEVDFKKIKNYKAHMHAGYTEINNTKCACVVKKWPYIGERYVKFAKEKGYEFDVSKHCLIETKIGKTISRSTKIHVSYLEAIDNCQGIRNVEGEDPALVRKMFSKLQSNMNIEW